MRVAGMEKDMSCLVWNRTERVLAIMSRRRTLKIHRRRGRERTRWCKRIRSCGRDGFMTRRRTNTAAAKSGAREGSH